MIISLSKDSVGSKSITPRSLTNHEHAWVHTSVILVNLKKNIKIEII